MVGGDSGGVKELEPGQAVIFERRGKSYVHWCLCAPHGAKIEGLHALCLRREAKLAQAYPKPPTLSPSRDI